MTNRILAAIVSAILLAACQAAPPPSAFSLSADSLQRRQTQTRRFDTQDEKSLLVAGAQVLQDLGFTIDESETGLGVIVASKTRDATESGQVAQAIVFTLLFGVNAPVDDKQKIRVSLVTRPLSGTEGVAARVTFQRTVWDTQGNISRVEEIDDAKIYQEFFAKLSQSVFLTAHEL